MDKCLDKKLHQQKYAKTMMWIYRVVYGYIWIRKWIYRNIRGYKTWGACDLPVVAKVQDLKVVGVRLAHHDVPDHFALGFPGNIFRNIDIYIILQFVDLKQLVLNVTYPRF